MCTRPNEIASFVNHALYNYFDTNCWELLSETTTRKLQESRFRTIGFVITNENLARVITRKVTLLYRLHLRASYPDRKCCTQREVSFVMHDANDIMHIVSIIYAANVCKCISSKYSYSMNTSNIYPCRIFKKCY